MAIGQGVQTARYNLVFLFLYLVDKFLLIKIFENKIMKTLPTISSEMQFYQQK